MARMIPKECLDTNGSYGERQVFEKLKQLPEEYVVFHSVRWNRRNEKNNIEWGESDFTVFHPKKGIIVIEVKSGGIECFRNEWSYIRTDNGERHSMKNPLEQACRSKYNFIDLLYMLLRNNDPNNKQYCMVEAAVWFPSVKSRDTIGELPMEFKSEIVLLENALDRPQDYIDKIYDFYDGRRHTRLCSESCDKIINSFAPYFRAVPSLKSKRLEQEEMFVRLTREQYFLLDYLEEQNIAAIQGAAGTGKTMLAVEKAKRLAKDGKVLFLCFNLFLKDYLNSLKEDDPVQYSNIEFYNLHKLAQEKMGGYLNLDKDAIVSFLKNVERYDWNYKHIIIDEGQDFVDEEIQKLYEVALLYDGAFYIFFDKNQFVQGKEFPAWLKNSECRLILNINCRNTYSIAETSGKSIYIQPRVMERTVRGDMPQFFICGDKKGILKKLSVLIDLYRNNGYPYEQICILTTKTEQISILNDVEKIGNHFISSVRKKNSVLFTTVRKFKGLEADVIIMVDIDESTFVNEENRRLFYVGSSRAKHNLDIVFAGSEEEFKSMANTISDKEMPNAMISLATGLSVKPIKI